MQKLLSVLPAALVQPTLAASTTAGQISPNKLPPQQPEANRSRLLTPKRRFGSVHLIVES
jgi:hypothetical protein